MKYDPEKVPKNNKTPEEELEDLKKFIKDLDEFDEASRSSKLRFD